MLTYPQMAHFPIVTRRRIRTVINRASDGRMFKLADPANNVTEWSLKYRDLSDAEAGALQQFFVAAEGSLNEFVFVDPTANLLAWSGKLDEPVWERDPMLEVSTLEDGVTRLTNTGTARQAITQTIDGPTDYTYCFSFYARSANSPFLWLMADGEVREQAIIPGWRRLRWSGRVEEATFGIDIEAGGVVDVRGLQVEPQAGPSTPQTSIGGGIYKGAHFLGDEIKLVATGLNRHACTVHIVHANHI